MLIPLHHLNQSTDTLGCLTHKMKSAACWLRLHPYLHCINTSRPTAVQEKTTRPQHIPASSTIKQNVANHNTHSHKPAGWVKKVTGVGGTTYEISVWLTKENQDSLGSFCPLSFSRMDVKLLNQTCKKPYKTTRRNRKCFPVKLHQSLWRTYTENMDQWRRILQPFCFSEYQYGTQIPQTFLVI